jgi:2-oxoglutarate dehydrogenase E1 component
MAQIFSEFSGKKLKGPDEREYTGSGDVKYHLGTSYNRPTINGKMVHLSLMANPSHLEVRERSDACCCCCCCYWLFTEA